MRRRRRSRLPGRGSLSTRLFARGSARGTGRGRLGLLALLPRPRRGSADPSRRFLALDVLAGLLLLACAAYALFLHPAPEDNLRVTLVDDGVPTVYVFPELACVSAGDLLARASVSLGSGDQLSHDLDGILQQGDTLSIRRAFPVAVFSGGDVTLLHLASGTVAAALAESGVAYDADDALSPPPHEALAPGMRIEHRDVVVDYRTSIETLPYDEINISDDTRYVGDDRLQTAGEDGEKQVTVRIVQTDGAITSREVVDQVVLKPAVDQVMVVGKKIRYQTNFTNDRRLWKPAPEQSQIHATLVVEITAYTHTGRRTATGTRPKLGTVAVNPSVIPYGTRLYIPGYGYATAEDTGAFRNRTEPDGSPKMQVDIFLDTERECNRWGRQRNKTIYILK